MNAIFFTNNTYVLGPCDKKVKGDVDISKVSELIYDESKRDYAQLYGGRVSIDSNCSCSCVTMQVDGINISRPSTDRNEFVVLDREIPLATAVAYLNQMENLGIDTFLENYKNQLQQFKAELEQTTVQMAQELSCQYTEEKNNRLERLRSSIRRLSCVLFLLLCHLNAGLDNHVYTDAYDTIANLYF